MCLCVRSPISIAHRSISGIPAGVHSSVAIDWVGFHVEKLHHLSVALAGKNADQSMVVQTVPVERILVHIPVLTANGFVSRPVSSASEIRKQPNINL